MSRNNSASQKKNFFLSLSENNKFIFVISLIIAIICWVAVSINQTTPTEKVISNVKVQINSLDSLKENYGLTAYGAPEQTVDVTVRGLSYLVNSSNFSADNIVVTASTSSVSAAGTYDLPLSHSINGAQGDIEIVALSSSSVRVYFDETVTKSFNLVEDIKELSGYSLAEGYIRENPRLSAETVSLTGPAREIGRITAVKAHVELNKAISATESFEAEIVAESDSGPLDMANITVNLEEPVYVTIPVNHTGTYDTAVEFTSMPQYYRTNGVKYTVSPATIEVTVASDFHFTDSNKVTVGSIDFSQINNTVNEIELKNSELASSTQTFKVNIDMSSMHKRWLPIPVEPGSASLPENVTVNTASVQSVQIVGPAASVDGIDSSAAYAVPVLDGVELTSGTHTVPAKVILRTLTDSWVYGSYTVDITVK